MAINYGSIEQKQKSRKPRQEHAINHAALNSAAEEMSDEELGQWFKQQVIYIAKTGGKNASARMQALKEIGDRVLPKKERTDAQMTSAEAVHIADIYDRLFGEGCHKCREALKCQ